MDALRHIDEGRRRRDFPGGLSLAGIAALAVIVLSILGLLGIEPVVLMSIAAVFIGIALLLGPAETARYPDLSAGEGDLSEGTRAFSSLAGLVGIVLGILSLIGVAPAALLPSSAIVFGCAILLEGTFGNAQSFSGSPEPVPMGRQYGSRAGSGVRLLCGAAAIVLGILALNGYSPAVLTLVAFLIAGCTQLLTGTNLVHRAATSVHRKI